MADDGRRSIDPDLSPTPTTPTGRGRAGALTSITLAISAMAISWLPFVVVLGVAAAISAIVLGIVALGRVEPGPSNSRAMALGGVTCGVLALALSGVGVSSSRAMLDDLRGVRDPGRHLTRVVSCVVDPDGRAVAAGEIRNLGERPRSYLVTVVFADSQGGFADRSVRVPVVDPGTSARFEATTSAGATPSSELTCRIEQVSSPTIVLGDT